MSEYQTGYFATPNRPDRRSKVHIVLRGKPICGTVHTAAEIEFCCCGNGVYSQYVECSKCKCTPAYLLATT